MILCDAKSSSSGGAPWRGRSRGSGQRSRPRTCTAPSCSGAPGAGSLHHGRIHRHHSSRARTARGVHRSHRAEPRGGRSAGAERAAAPDTARQRRDPLRRPVVRHRRPEAARRRRGARSSPARRRVAPVRGVTHALRPRGGPVETAAGPRGAGVRRLGGRAGRGVAAPARGGRADARRPGGVPQRPRCARDQSAAHGMAALAAPPATPRRAARARPHGPPRRDGAHPHVHGRGEASGGTALVLRLPSCDLRRALAGERRLSRRGAPGAARGVRRGPPRVVSAGLRGRHPAPRTGPPAHARSASRGARRWEAVHSVHRSGVRGLVRFARDASGGSRARPRCVISARARGGRDAAAFVGAADRGVPGSGRHVAAAAGGAWPRDRGPLGRAGGGVRAHTALPRAGHRDPRRLHGYGIRVPPIGADAGPARVRRRRLHGSIRHRGAVPAGPRAGGTTGLGAAVADRRGITPTAFLRTTLPSSRHTCCPRSAGVSSRFRSRNLSSGPFQAGERVRPLQRRVAAMRTVYPVALAALVVSCHLDKLLNDGGGNGPPSEAAPARVAFSSSLGNARAGQPISPPVQVTVQDSAGRVTLRDTLVTLSLAANPSGDSLRGRKQVRSVNGVATFDNVRLDKAASGYRLTAAAPELHPDTSGAFSVMPAPATVLAFTGPPSVTMQDSAMKPVQVTAYDSLGNKATNFAGSIRLGIGTDGSVSKKAGLTGGQASAVAGVATFPNLRIDSVGTGYTLTAAFGSAAPVDTSVPFDITQGPPPPPPPPTHLRFTQQPQQTTEAGATITPPVQVAAFDASDHVVQGFTGAIGLALEPASNGGTLSGGTPINAVNGIATFPSLSVDKAGTGYTLRATASGLTDGTSNTFNVTPPPPTTGDLTVTTSTTGSSQPASYTVTVDGGSSRTISANGGTTTYIGLSATSHTVALTDVPANCTASGGASHTVTVTAGQTTTEPFSISCAATTGDLTVTAATTGSSQPASYTVTVDGGSSRTISANGGTTTYTGLSATSHTVALTDVPTNCTASGGASHTVTVTAGQTTTEPFSISCVATTGSLTVSTTTTGPEQPSGYTVSVTGGGSQTVGATGSVTFTGLVTGSHTVTLSGAPTNCSVSGGPSQTVNVTAGQTATASYTISCAATTGSLTVTAATTGSSQPASYTVTVDGGSSRTISANGGTTTYTGLSATSHTVGLTDVPTNCTASGGASHTVTVTAGQTTTEPFSISCVATTGSLTVSTTTTGSSQPASYTVTVDGGSSRTISANGSVTFNGLVTGSHTVTLSEPPSNCSVSGGTSQTVNVAAGQTATASFSISCTALTGSLTVTTATSGSNPPSGYTVTVDGGQSR